MDRTRPGVAQLVETAGTWAEFPVVLRSGTERERGRTEEGERASESDKKEMSTLL